MSTLDEKIALLTDAIAGGERQVALGSEQVTYRSVSELIAARNELLRLKQESEPMPRRTSRQMLLYHAGRGY